MAGFSVKVTERPVDGFDVQNFEAMLHSPQFQLVEDSIRLELRRATEACCTAVNDLEIHRAQGAVLALTAVLRIPANILERMKPKRKPPGRADHY